MIQYSLNQKSKPIYTHPPKYPYLPKPHSCVSVAKNETNLILEALDNIFEKAYEFPHLNPIELKKYCSQSVEKLDTTAWTKDLTQNISTELNRQTNSEFNAKKFKNLRFKYIYITEKILQQKKPTLIDKNYAAIKDKLTKLQTKLITTIFKKAEKAINKEKEITNLKQIYHQLYLDLDEIKIEPEHRLNFFQLAPKALEKMKNLYTKLNIKDKIQLGSVIIEQLSLIFSSFNSFNLNPDEVTTYQANETLKIYIEYEKNILKTLSSALTKSISTSQSIDELSETFGLASQIYNLPAIIHKPFLFPKIKESLYTHSKKLIELLRNTRLTFDDIQKTELELSKNEALINTFQYLDNLSLITATLNQCKSSITKQYFQEINKKTNKKTTKEKHRKTKIKKNKIIKPPEKKKPNKPSTTNPATKLENEIKKKYEKYKQDCQEWKHRQPESSLSAKTLTFATETQNKLDTLNKNPVLRKILHSILSKGGLVFLQDNTNVSTDLFILNCSSSNLQTIKQEIWKDFAQQPPIFFPKRQGVCLLRLEQNLLEIKQYNLYNYSDPEQESIKMPHDVETITNITVAPIDHPSYLISIPDTLSQITADTLNSKLNFARHSITRNDFSKDDANRWQINP